MQLDNEPLISRPVSAEGQIVDMVLEAEGQLLNCNEITVGNISKTCPHESHITSVKSLKSLSSVNYSKNESSVRSLSLSSVDNTDNDQLKNSFNQSININHDENKIIAKEECQINIFDKGVYIHKSEEQNIDSKSETESLDSFFSCLDENEFEEKTIVEGIIYIQSKNMTHPNIEPGKSHVFQRFFNSFSFLSENEEHYPFTIINQLDDTESFVSFCTDQTSSEVEDNFEYFKPLQSIIIKNKEFNKITVEEKIENFRDFIIEPFISLLSYIQNHKFNLSMLLISILFSILQFKIYFWCIYITSPYFLQKVKLGHRFTEDKRKGRNKFKEKYIGMPYTVSSLESVMEEVRLIYCDLSVDDKITIPFLMNDKDVLGQLDSGSGVNLISHALLKAAYPNYKTFKRAILYKLFNVSKQRIPIVCARMIPIYIRGVGEILMPFHISYRSNICLLGRQFMSATNIELKVRGSKVSINMSLEQNNCKYVTNTMSNVYNVELMPRDTKSIEFDTSDLNKENNEYFILKNNLNLNILSYRVVKLNGNKIILTVRNDSATPFILSPGEAIISCIPWEPNSPEKREEDLNTIHNFKHKQNKVNLIQNLDLGKLELRKYSLYRKFQFLYEEIVTDNGFVVCIDSIFKSFFDIDSLLSSCIEYCKNVYKYYEIRKTHNELDEHLVHYEFPNKQVSPFRTRPNSV